MGWLVAAGWSPGAVRRGRGGRRCSVSAGAAEMPVGPARLWGLHARGGRGTRGWLHEGWVHPRQCGHVTAARKQQRAFMGAKRLLSQWAYPLAAASAGSVRARAARCVEWGGSLPVRRW